MITTTPTLTTAISDAQIRALSKLTFDFQTTRRLHSDRLTYFRMMYGKHFRNGILQKPLCEARASMMYYTGRKGQKYFNPFPVWSFRLTEAGKEFLKTADTTKFATHY